MDGDQFTPPPPPPGAAGTAGPGSSQDRGDRPARCRLARRLRDRRLRDRTGGRRLVIAGIDRRRSHGDVVDAGSNHDAPGDPRAVSEHGRLDVHVGLAGTILPTPEAARRSSGPPHHHSKGRPSQSSSFG